MDPLILDALKTLAAPVAGVLGVVFGWWQGRRIQRAQIRKTDVESEKLATEMLRLQQQSNTELLDRLATMQKRILDLMPLEIRILELERKLEIGKVTLEEIQERLAHCEKFRSDWITDRR